MPVHILVSVVAHGTLEEAHEAREGHGVARPVHHVVEHAQVAKEVLRWQRNENEMG